MASLSLRFELFLSALRRKRGTIFHNSRGAINGYDPVAYFENGEPVKGEKEFSHTWEGAKWYFSSAANRDLFMISPEKYAPQFGGFCAYGVHNGYKIHADPHSWTIYEGMLFLNYNERVQQIWRAEPDKCIEVATENWERLKAKF